MYRKVCTIMLTSAALALVFPATASAQTEPLSGAIFTTDVTGVPVNLNIYDAKEDVYLNGGPGINAPDDAAGLPAGTYSFQVTSPSGKTLLSTDDVSCRQFTVDASGRIQSVAPGGACAHATGIDGEDLGITVQLFPFDDTPNNGGVYKVWVTPTELLDCDAPGNKHCFVPADSKTDNFKVRKGAIVEIDTRFHKGAAWSMVRASPGSTRLVPATRSTRSTTRRSSPSTRRTLRRPSRGLTPSLSATRPSARLAARTVRTAPRTSPAMDQ